MKITQAQRNALEVILEFVERYNKKDDEILVAEAADILRELLD